VSDIESTATGDGTGIAAILREFPAFLRRPRLVAPSGLRAAGAWKRLAVLVALQLAGLFLVLLPLLQLWQGAFGLPSPDAYGELPPGLLVPVVVLVAPVIEEMLFRGWLTGRVRALWLLACALGAGAFLYASTQGLQPLPAGGGILALLVAAPIGWFVLRKRGTPGWFGAAFPAIFYLMAAVFALSHMMNYPSFSALALPMVLPQLWAALVLGFIRLRIGLPASMLAHIVSNSAALALALLVG